MLADKGYTGADVGIVMPTKRRKGIHRKVGERTLNALLVAVRAVAARAKAVLVMRWHTLRRVTLDRATIDSIASAALVLARFEAAPGRGRSTLHQ